MSKAQSIDFSFSYDPAVTAIVKKELFDTVSRQNPVQSELLRDALESRNVPEEFEQRLADYTLSANNVADAMLGYWIVMWSIIHDKPLPPPGPGIESARKQISALVASNPIVRKGGDESRRQMVGEAMIFESIISLEVRDEVKKRGNEDELRDLSESTHHNLLRKHMNLRAMDLTEQGFVRAK